MSIPKLHNIRIRLHVIQMITKVNGENERNGYFIWFFLLLFIQGTGVLSFHFTIFSFANVLSMISDYNFPQSKILYNKHK